MPKRPSKSLELGAVVFAVLWTLWVLLWSGSFDRINIAMLSLCGAAVGYAWYFAMRRQLRRNGSCTREQDAADVNLDR
jgi:hypothetical protein